MIPASARRQPFKRTERRLSRRPLTTTAKISDRMGRVRQRDTAPELAVRRALWSLGLRYTTHNDDLPGSPDLANRRKRWAVFVHGCYWHRHRRCSKATTPKTNVAFWMAKFSRNVARDRQVRTALRKVGFDVLTVWQCETVDLETLRTRLRREIRSY